MTSASAPTPPPDARHDAAPPTAAASSPGGPGDDGPLLIAEHLYKTYRLGRVDVPVLRGADIAVNAGEWVAVLGASGSGKSTLLHLLGALDHPDGRRNDTTPRLVFRGRDLLRASSSELNHYRNRSVGFVFQFYHLLPELNVLENTMLAAYVRWGRFGLVARRAEVRNRAIDLLKAFGLGHRLRHRPAKLSGGERQRVAIARALMNDPDLLLADEPTGNLDATTGDQILDVIEGVARTARRKQAIVMVTHDVRVARRADRIVRLESGEVVGTLTPKAAAAAAAVTAAAIDGDRGAGLMDDKSPGLA